MSELRNIGVIALYSFREVVKSRIMVNVLLIGFAQLVVTYVASEFTYGVPEKVALDFGLGVMNLAVLGIAIFIGVNLISREIESRTIYMILARPVSRTSFILGKVGGLSLILFVNVVILGAFSLITYLYLGGSFNTLIIWTLFFSFVESFMMLQVVVFFSLITNTILAVLFSVSAYIIGSVAGSTLLLSFTSKEPILFHLVKWGSIIFPNISKFSIRDFVLYEQSLSYVYLLGTTAYGVLYSLLLLVASLLIFSQKDLD